GTARTTKGRRRMFQGYIDQDRAIAVEASAIPDVLFERGLYWASGRSGVVNLVAAHKWFNLAALKGRSDAVSLRREVAEMMSEVEIAMAQREARAWMTAHRVRRRAQRPRLPQLHMSEELRADICTWRRHRLADETTDGEDHSSQGARAG